MNTKNLSVIVLAIGAAVAIGSCERNPTPDATNGDHATPSDAAPAEQLTMLPAPKVLRPDSRIDAAIRNVRERQMLTTNAFWTVFHGILGLGPDVTLLEPETGLQVNALDWIRNGGEIRGLQFLPTKFGLDVRTGPVMVGQGHQDQYVAEMAEWGMPADRKFMVLGKEYTFMDFVRHTQMRARVNSNQELSWAVIVVAQYFGTDATWVNGSGEKLTCEDLVRYEVDASVNEATCICAKGARPTASGNACKKRRRNTETLPESTRIRTAVSRLPSSAVPAILPINSCASIAPGTRSNGWHWRSPMKN
jgi:hypothetical protein